MNNGWTDRRVDACLGIAAHASGARTLSTRWGVAVCVRILRVSGPSQAILSAALNNVRLQDIGWCQALLSQLVG